MSHKQRQPCPDINQNNLMSDNCIAVLPQHCTGARLTTITEGSLGRRVLDRCFFVVSTPRQTQGGKDAAV